MKIQQLFQEQMKSFDKDFGIDWTGDSAKRDGSRLEIRSFIKAHTRKLIEALGREIIGKKQNEFPMYEQRDFDKMAVKIRNNLKSKQRLKLKEILSNLK